MRFGNESWPGGSVPVYFMQGMMLVFKLKLILMPQKNTRLLT